MKKDLSIISASQDRNNTKDKTLETENDLKKMLKRFQCLQKKDAHNFCFYQGCSQKYGFLCADSDCKCNQVHQACQKIGLKTTLKKILQKIHETKETRDLIQKEINLIINMFTSLKERLIGQMQTTLKYVELSDFEKAFLNIANGTNATKLGELSRFVYVKTQNQQKPQQQDLFKLSDLVKKSLVSINQTIKKDMQQINQKLVQIQFKYEQKKRETEDKLKLHIETFTEAKKYLDNSQIYKYSSIIQSKEQLDKIKSFFAKSKRVLRNMSLLYKASDQQYKLSRYYEKKCGQVANTLIICKTKHNRIIGGFSPLPFQAKGRKGGYIADKQKLSFIFSLSTNDKFTLKNFDGTGAIYAFQKEDDAKYICFGNSEFTIGDLANSTKSCCSKVNKQYYHNFNYAMNNRQAYLKFNGTEQQKFSVQQWQVWQVKIGIPDNDDLQMRSMRSTSVSSLQSNQSTKKIT